MTKSHFSKPLTCLITRTPVTLKFTIVTRFESCRPVSRRLQRATCTGQSVCGLLFQNGSLRCNACPHLPTLADSECVLDPRPVLPKRSRVVRRSPGVSTQRAGASPPARGVGH